MLEVLQMTRIMSLAQKKSVYDAIPNSYTVEGVQFNPSKIYYNQLANNLNYPLIVLNYPQQGTIKIEDINGVLYYMSVLTIHVLAVDYKSGSTFVNGAKIVEGIASSIIDAIKTWTTPLSNDVRILNEHDILPIKNVSEPEEGVYDYIISVNLYHS